MNELETMTDGEALFRLIFEQTAVGVCVFDLQGLVVRINPACCRLSGWSETQVVGRHWTQMTHPEDTAAEMKFILALRNGELDTYTLQKRFLDPEGGSLWTEVTVSVLRGAQGVPVCYLAIIVDRSDVHRTERALRHAEEHLHFLVENTPDGLALLRNDSTLLYMNGSLARRLNLDPLNSVGRKIAELGLPEDKTRLWDAVLQQVVLSGQPEETQYEWDEHTYEWRLIPEFAPAGHQEARILSQSRDVTEKVRAQHERQQRLLRAERLEAVGRSLAEAGLDSQTAMNAIAEFAANFIGGLCFITLLSDDGQSLHARALYGPDTEVARSALDMLNRAPFRANGPVFSKVVGPAQPLCVAAVPPGFLRSVLRPEHLPFADLCDVYSLLAVPMRANRTVLGAVTLVSTTPDRQYSEEDQALLQELADRAALTLASAQLYQRNLEQAEELRQANLELERRVTARTRELAKANEQLQNLASHDPLTGLANRRQFDESLENELRRARRDHRWVALLMVDVDFFKKYNDRYGHVAGDQCLQTIAATLQSCFRRGAELAARYGGEEFAVILPDVEPEQARESGERLCRAVEEKRLPHAGSEVAPHVTVSVGVACFRSAPDTDPEWCIRTADSALYASKAGGRNRVTVSVPFSDGSVRAVHARVEE